MSSHPNAILMLVLKPDGLARKTYREILAKYAPDYEEGVNEHIEIGSEKYNSIVMEEEYDEGFQVEAEEGDIVVFDMVTYGYGEKIKWDDLAKQKEVLESWAQEVCKEFTCSYQIYVTANHW